MSSNILVAIKNISDLENNNLSDYFESYSAKIENVRQQIQYYLKDAISETSKSAKEKNQKTDTIEFSHMKEIKIVLLI
ncbi:MAG: hypothetical protein P8X97_03450 [Candidatus Bathyarchaeota archaeon]